MQLLVFHVCHQSHRTLVRTAACAREPAFHTMKPEPWWHSGAGVKRTHPPGRLSGVETSPSQSLYKLELDLLLVAAVWWE